MEKSTSKEKTIKILSRAQTARIRQNLQKTFYNIKSKTQKLNILNRPLTSFHDNKLSQLYLPFHEYDNELKIAFKEKDEYQKAHLKEINIQNLFTEKLWGKKNLEKNIDYTKNISYKKLIMRAKLLKAMKTNIVLRQRQFDEYNSKYYKGSKLLSEKLKNKKKMNKTDDISSEEEKEEKPNFNTIKTPDIFSEYEYTSLFQDYFCSPIELIKKIFNNEEQKIIKLDPIFFRLNKGPFIGVQKNLRFTLKDKINEEDEIYKEKMEKMKKINQRFIYIKRKHTRKNTEKEKSEALKESSKDINIINNNIKTLNNNKIKSTTPQKFFFPNNTKNNANKINEIKKLKNFFLISKSAKKRKKLKIDTFNKNSKKKLNINLNTDYNVYLEIKKNNKKKKRKAVNYLYSDEEKIKDKKKRLTIEELIEIYNERKKVYLEDMSYNRKKNKFRFEQLRIKKHKENEKENQIKDNLRKILTEIEDNYKLYQK